MPFRPRTPSWYYGPWVFEYEPWSEYNQPWLLDAAGPDWGGRATATSSWTAKTPVTGSDWTERTPII